MVYPYTVISHKITRLFGTVMFYLALTVGSSALLKNETTTYATNFLLLVGIA